MTHFENSAEVDPFPAHGSEFVSVHVISINHDLKSDTLKSGPGTSHDCIRGWGAKEPTFSNAKQRECRY